MLEAVYSNHDAVLPLASIPLVDTRAYILKGRSKDRAPLFEPRPNALFHRPLIGFHMISDRIICGFSPSVMLF
jgi:hypothetical protein